MLKVIISSLDDNGEPVKIATLSWDGKRFITEPKDAKLGDLLDQPIILTNKNKIKIIESKKDPETFLKNMYLKYRNPYFQVSKAK